MRSNLLATVLTVAFGIQVAPCVVAFAESAPISETDLLMREGTLAYERGAFEQALATWKETAKRYEQAGRIKEQSRALVQAAQAAQAIGEIKLALQQLELALSLAQQAGDQAWIATVSDSLGRAYLGTRQPDAASHYLDHALELARAHGNPALTAAVLNDVGILRATQARYKDALAAFREGASLAQGANQDALAVRARINAARAAVQLKQFVEANTWLDEAGERLQQADASYEKAAALVSLGLGYSDASRGLPDASDALLLSAAGSFMEAASVADRLKDSRTASYAWGHLGHLYETEHRYEEALPLTRRAVFAAQSASAPESLYRWQWQSGRILAALNQLDEAIGSYRSAIHALEPIRPEVSLSAQNPGSAAPDSVRPLYFEYADLLLHRAARMDEGEASQGYLKAARDAIETSKAVELRDYFRDECVDAAQGHITTLDEVSKTTAVLYPIVLPDRTELLVSLPGGLKRVTVPVSSAALTQEVRSLRRMLEKRTTREYLPHAQQLFDWLLRPLEPDLAAAKIDTLVFVPDGPLRTIPMAALHDGKHFLISTYAVASTPGLNLTDPRPINRAKIKMLSSGLTEASQGFPPLPHVSVELKAIRNLYGGDQLVNRDFVILGLENELKDRPVSMLHIASHGRFEREVGRSFILAYDGKLTMERLDQYVGLFKFRKDPLELLTLSACETAVGDDRAALGLAGVAIKAGARSALATLWSINDEASSSLVAEFYLQLGDQTASKAVALQRAQLKLLADNAYDHPAYWSPFLLLNNWL